MRYGIANKELLYYKKHYIICDNVIGYYTPISFCEYSKGKHPYNMYNSQTSLENAKSLINKLVEGEKFLSKTISDDNELCDAIYDSDEEELE